MEDLSEEYKRLESYVKTLLNNQLKDILKKEGLQVTGVKAVLQSRILERLNELILTGDAAGFRDFRQKIKPQAAPPNTSSSAFMPHFADQYRTMPNGSRPMANAHHSSGTALHFTPSPFYKVICPLTKIETLPVMQSNRNTVSVQLVLDNSQVDRIKDVNVRIMLYSAIDASHTRANHVAFPQQVEVKINDDTLHANLRGIKKKVGTTRPADITAMIRKVPGYTNKVSMTYAATDSRYEFVVQLVRKSTVEELVQKIEAGHVISKTSVLNEMLSIANDDDIVVSSSVMSLKCPLSFMRIQLPCRFSTCKHNQCFDATSFLQVQEQAPQWTCPVCNRVSSFENLVIDEYFRDILRRTSSSTESVVVEPDGEWRVASKDDEQKPKSNTHRTSKELAPDEDELEIIELPKTNGIKSEAMTPQFMMSPSANTEEAPTATFNRSSAPKRKRDVIDLTNDSDDDDPPLPPAKRSVVGTSTLPSSAVVSHAASPVGSTSSSHYPMRPWNQANGYSQATGASTYSSSRAMPGSLPSPAQTSNFGGYVPNSAVHQPRDGRFNFDPSNPFTTRPSPGSSNGRGHRSTDFGSWA